MLANNPTTSTSTTSGQPITPGKAWVLKSIPLRESMADPIKAPKVPIKETPPEVPMGTFLKVMIDRGSPLASTPSSVAHVSAVTAASEAM